MSGVIEELLIPARYCGPPNSANGGYTAGALAHALIANSGADAASMVSVRLQQPPPLDEPMSLRVIDDGLELSRDGAAVAVARFGGEEIEPVEPVGPAEAMQASATFTGLTDHPFATCFSCGPARDDGLGIFPGAVEPVEGLIRMAARWTPDDSIRADFHELDAPDARTCMAATWAALDCIGGWAGGIGESRPAVLGSMTARIEALPTIGEPHVVMGQGISTEGRKTLTASTLYDSDGRIVGLARHTWITIDPADFGGKP